LPWSKKRKSAVSLTVCTVWSGWAEMTAVEASAWAEL
jgi:hypothetical protein